MAQNLPYYHPSVSELAKALRKSIQTELVVELGQTSMLQLLAKAAGFQNYQSYKSLRELGTQDEQGHLIKVSCNLHEAGEVFETDANTGRALDRRHETVTNVLARVTLTVNTSSTIAAFKCTVRTAIANLSEREMAAPERILSVLLMQYIARDPERFFGALNLMSPLEVDIQKDAIKHYPMVNETTHGELIINPVITASVHQRVITQSQAVEQAIRKYEHAISFLKNLAFSNAGTMSASDKEIAKESLKFIEHAMEISTEKGMMTMYSWNQEKFPAIARFITALINDRPFDDYDKQSAMRNLSAWRAGEVWIGQLPI